MKMHRLVGAALALAMAQSAAAESLKVVVPEPVAMPSLPADTKVQAVSLTRLGSGLLIKTIPPKGLTALAICHTPVELSQSTYEPDGVSQNINFFIPIDEALKALALAPVGQAEKAAK
jgi:hypothetical protein